jgi:hypothetical protein
MIPPRAYLFIALNVIRIISITALLLVFASSIFTLVQDVTAWNRFVDAGYSNSISVGKNMNNTVIDIGDDYASGSTVPNQPGGPFFAVLNWLFIIFQTIVLIMAELEYPSNIFDRFFPVLGSEFGLGALGLFQAFIGAAVLSHHVNRFMLGSAFFLFVIGCVNAVLVGILLREKAKSKRSITSWKEHSRSVLPSVGPYTSSSPPTFVSHLYTGSSMSKGSFGCGDRFDEKFAGRGFGRQGEKAKMKDLDIPKPDPALPKYLSRPGSTRM